jgi:glycosyltransferase involved in cell wall biosynthesis
MRIGINARHILGQKDGVGYYTYHLIQNLMFIDKHNEYVVFLPETCPFQLDNRNFRPSSMHFTTFSKLSRGFWEHVIMPFESFKERLDLLHCPAHISPCISKGKRVVTIHDLSFLVIPQIFPKPLYFYYLHLISYAARHADKIIAVSHNTEQDLSRLLKIPPSKIKVIYQGINPVYRPVTEPSEVDKLKQRYNIKDKFILYLGAITARKNLIRLIRAYYLLKKAKGIEQQLVIAGPRGYPHSGEVTGIVKELGLEQDVVFTGYIDEHEALLLYNAALLFVYPSLYEGFGLPVLEAMACGCPVIASRTSSLPEISGDAAVFFDTYDIDEIADLMYTVVVNRKLREDLIQKGFARALQFQWANTARETLGLYRGLISG